MSHVTNPLPLHRTQVSDGAMGSDVAGVVLVSVTALAADLLVVAPVGPPVVA
jgi:hypothetical protein